jgi:Putative adhesin
MNKSLIINILLLFIGAIPSLAQSDVKEQLTIPLTNPGKPGVLDIGLVAGSIHVVGYAGKDVVIDAVAGTTRRDGAENRRIDTRTNNHNANRDNEPGMKRIPTGNSMDLSAEEKNNRVHVSTGMINKPITLTIKVPYRFSLKLSTVNNGDITVDNVTGELEINNINGAIILTNISGSAVANTINGDLRATFREVDTNAPMAFSTLNNRVDVTFPASVKANVKLKSDRGDIFSDFDIAIDKRQPQATRANQSGMFRVTIEDWVYGKINGGGPEVMMKSMNGSIYVRKGK